MCKIFDGGDATITSLEVHPATGRKGRVCMLSTCIGHVNTVTSGYVKGTSHGDMFLVDVTYIVHVLHDR